MAIVQCSNNHYYDNRRSQTCPYCEKIQDNPYVLEEINEQMTSYMDDEFDDAVPTEGYGDFVESEDKTIGIFLDEKENLLTVGWLVCVEGPEKGRSYPFFSGRNFAGRSTDMDLILYDDREIVRDRHFSLVYDPRSIAFYLVAGNGHTYVNEGHVSDQRQLSDGDVIRVGGSRYIFVPYCKKGREWK